MIEKHYRENYSILLNLAKRTGFSLWDAEDIVQETYLRAWEYKEHANEGTLDNWIRGIFWRTRADCHRKENDR